MLMRMAALFSILPAVLICFPPLRSLPGPPKAYVWYAAAIFILGSLSHTDVVYPMGSPMEETVSPPPIVDVSCI